MAEPLAGALERVRADVLDPDTLVRAVLSGRRRGQEPPSWRRVELRWVDLRAGRRLQVTPSDATQAHTTNHQPGPAADEALDPLLARGHGNWRPRSPRRTEGSGCFMWNRRGRFPTTRRWGRGWQRCAPPLNRWRTRAEWSCISPANRLS